MRLGRLKSAAGRSNRIYGNLLRPPGPPGPSCFGDCRPKQCLQVDCDLEMLVAARAHCTQLHAAFDARESDSSLCARALWLKWISLMLLAVPEEDQSEQEDESSRTRKPTILCSQRATS